MSASSAEAPPVYSPPENNDTSAVTTPVVRLPNKTTLEVNPDTQLFVSREPTHRASAFLILWNRCVHIVLTVDEKCIEILLAP